jgi:hypothetical protein
MSLLRIILIALAAFFAIRVVRSLARVLMNRRPRGEEEGTVSGRPESRPLDKPFRDATDASFEDLGSQRAPRTPGDRPS